MHEVACLSSLCQNAETSLTSSRFLPVLFQKSDQTCVRHQHYRWHTTASRGVSTLGVVLLLRPHKDRRCLNLFVCLQGPWISRQSLHAARMRITHPLTGHPLVISAPLPPDILRAATQLVLDVPIDKHGTSNNAATSASEVEQLVDHAWHTLHGTH